MIMIFQQIDTFIIIQLVCLLQKNKGFRQIELGMITFILNALPLPKSIELQGIVCANILGVYLIMIMTF